MQYFLNERWKGFRTFSCLFVKKIQKKVSACFHEIAYYFNRENSSNNTLQMPWSGNFFHENANRDPPKTFFCIQWEVNIGENRLITEREADTEIMMRLREGFF